MKWEGRPFWSGQAQIYPLSLTYGANVNYCVKCSSYYSYSACWSRENPGNFQNKSISSPFNWVSRYILFLAKLRGKKDLIWRVQEGGPHCERLVVIKDVYPFVKFEIILPLWTRTHNHLVCKRTLDHLAKVALS